MSDAETKSPTPVYLVWTRDLWIDAPPISVWPHVLDYPAWQQFEISEQVSGRPRHEGEVVLLKKIEAGFDFPPYYARTILLEPERRIIWKTYEHESSTMGFTGYVDFTLKLEGKGTRFTYNILYEFLIEDPTEDGRARFRSEQFEASQRVFDSIFPKLKKLAEGGTK